MRKTMTGAAIAAMVLTATAAMAADAAVKCEAGKNSTAGKYAACLHKAQSKFVSGSLDTNGRDIAVLDCGTKYSTKWQSLETKAEGGCPVTGDETAIQHFLDACIFSAEFALGGGALPTDVATCNTNLGTCNGNLGTCNGSLGTCNAGTAAAGDVLTTKTFSSAAGLGVTGTMTDKGAVTLTPSTTDQAIAAGYHNGSGKCEGDADLVAGNIKNGVNIFGVVGNVSCSLGAGSYTDNGDGTITDNVTGLMWEKLSVDGSIHDWANAYTWADAFAVKAATLNTMNAGAGFANHTDWRVPTVVELQSLTNFETSNPTIYSAFNTACASGCTVTSCSCTQPGAYWSSSTVLALPSTAWFVSFGLGGTNWSAKTGAVPVRAVRAGS